MISPYVRRLRLGMELRALRAEHNYTQARVARIIGKSRMEISRLENGQSADPADVLNILEALGVEGERWTGLAAIAQDACARGWWESVKHIGERQALYADLEAGAATIRAYEPTYPPGLLQLPEYIESIYQAPAALEPLSGTVEGFLAGRAGRQRNLRRPGGPSFEVIVEENAVLRLGAPGRPGEAAIAPSRRVRKGQPAEREAAGAPDPGAYPGLCAAAQCVLDLRLPRPRRPPRGRDRHRNLRRDPHRCRPGNPLRAPL